MHSVKLTAGFEREARTLADEDAFISAAADALLEYSKKEQDLSTILVRISQYDFVNGSCRPTNVQILLF
jgi:hypothetical protein